jgi:hypothetical protein
VEYRPNTNTSNIIYTYKYVLNMCSKMGLVVETKGGRKEGKVLNNEIRHTCVGVRRKETHCKLLTQDGGRKGKEVQRREITLT